MKPIVLQLSPEEAQNCLILFDIAVKSNKGGLKVAKAAMVIVDKINAAATEAQKPDAQ